MGRAVTAWSFALTALLFGVLLIGLSVPFVFGSVPPNGTYGFRTSKTLSDPAIWFIANAVAAKLTIAVGIVMLALGPLLLRLSRSKTLSDQSILLFGLTFEIAPLVLLFVLLVVYGATLKKSPDHHDTPQSPIRWYSSDRQIHAGTAVRSLSAYP